MADTKKEITTFRDLLRDNRMVVLEHNGRRYKAKSVIQVMYSSRNDVQGSDCRYGSGACPGCGDGATSIHVVMVTGEVCFVVEVWEGCTCYDATIDISSVDEKPHLKQLLEASPNGYEYEDILAALFPRQIQQVQKSSSSSSSDSY